MLGRLCSCSAGWCFSDPPRLPVFALFGQQNRRRDVGGRACLPAQRQRVFSRLGAWSKMLRSTHARSSDAAPPPRPRRLVVLALALAHVAGWLPLSCALPRRQSGDDTPPRSWGKLVGLMVGGFAAATFVALAVRAVLHWALVARVTLTASWFVHEAGAPLHQRPAAAALRARGGGAAGGKPAGACAGAADVASAASAVAPRRHDGGADLVHRRAVHAAAAMRQTRRSCCVTKSWFVFALS